MNLRYALPVSTETGKFFLHAEYKSHNTCLGTESGGGRLGQEKEILPQPLVSQTYEL